MSLFYISIFKKDALKDANPIWESSIDALNVEEAYRIGKDQFLAENPDNNLDELTVKASGYQVEKYV